MSMTKSMLLSLALAIAAGCSPNEPPTTPVDPSGEPGTVSETDAELQSATASEYAAACETGIDDVRKQFVTLQDFQGEATVDSVLVPYNTMQRDLINVAYPAQLYFLNHPDAGVRAAAATCEQRVDDLNTEIGLSRPLYDAIVAVDVSGEDETTRHFVSTTLRDFRINGVDKDEATRTRIRSLNEEITKLGQEFDSNVPSDVRSISVDSAAELAGMPQDWIDAHPPGADGKITITTDYPDYIPFMRYADNDALRKKLYLEYQNRAYPKNEEVLSALIAKRYELARLTGFDNWADRATADKMTGSAAEAWDFIRGGLEASQPRAEADYQMYLARLRQVDPEAEAVYPWQSSWIGNKIRQEKYQVDSAALRAYFEYSKVRDGIFNLTRNLFGLEIRNWSGAETWDPSVETYELFDDGELVGRFYLDMHPRPDKFKHAAMFQVETGYPGGPVPRAALITNFPGGEEKGYLEQTQVETFLHEFGHLIHFLVSNRQRWTPLTTPEWDFIEAPSMMLQEWIYDTATLQSFAINEAGETIPGELVEKLRAAQNFGQGLFINGQMFYAAVSLNYYNRDPASFDLLQLYKDLSDKYSVIPYVDGAHQYASFGHLNGYSAYYYTYMWSQVIAYDMFSRFEDEGLLDPTAAQEYLEFVLVPGGARPAADSVAEFLGRPYNFDAFQRRLDEGS
ncbi:MAG: M3 family metallopeptidase [Gammaproteobacteria bacterium]